jgi:polyisoprenoid-binding protein YceI
LFETDTYPTMTFRSTGIRHNADGFDVDGELSLHGVTRPVTLALDVNDFTRDPYGGTRAGFSATVSRSSSRLQPSSAHPHRPVPSAHRR